MNYSLYLQERSLQILADLRLSLVVDNQAEVRRNQLRAERSAVLGKHCVAGVPPVVDALCAVNQRGLGGFPHERLVLPLR
ncbi:hypothetical protein [Dendronalium sp. ChiSLP03b]|uniref:hypothetical protein n=1 Tax=Dendronalium sp. ChiSLP03b TaxID=3075381 RepID=UPI002AD3E93E|nr:hypothetical protein [Dendronalium sp. ChiSLP03b]MDZ8208326.1 hypothetical protein [Dendronalium sp. ChiSLP03b]